MTSGTGTVVILPGEEELKFYIFKALFEVVEIEGEEIDGSPTYEIDPVNNFVTLSQALSTAYTALENPYLQIEAWKLSFDEGTWLYKYETEEEEDIEIYVNAASGELIGIYGDGKNNDDDDQLALASGTGPSQGRLLHLATSY